MRRDLPPKPFPLSLQSLIGAFIALLVLGIGLTSENANASAPAFAGLVIPQAPQVPNTYAPECGPNWNVVPSPNVGNDNHLLGVDGVASDDVWAVGEHAIGDAFQTLVEHWDGSAWSVVPSPNVAGNFSNSLREVTAISSSDVWAVGRGGDAGALIEHWDGSVWSVIPGGYVETYNALTSIDAISSNDVWAVGNVGNRTLIEHWDGSAWSVIPSPNVGTNANTLFDVDAISSNDVWAVGNYAQEDDPENQALAMHWDGNEWTIVTVPNPKAPEGYLHGTYLHAVSAVSSNDVWAVGNYWPQGPDSPRTLTVHWDGSAWSVVPSPSPDELGSYLRGVNAESSSDVWAVGYDANGRPLIEHWDGSAWSVVPDSITGYNLFDVVAVSSDDVWAVGTTSNETLIARYNPIPCSPTPTPIYTPEPPRCPGERFTDVCPTDYFYQHVLDLNDLDIVSGYNTVPPCESQAHIPCFKPYNWATRGQIAKVVSLSAGFSEPPGEQLFEDVPSGHTFYDYIQRMANRSIAIGYPCGGPGEPCNPPNNRPYFRPANTVSRGQLSKMAALAFGFNEPVSGQSFEDVPPGHTFYEYIERLARRGIIEGYPCGGPGEPCVPPDMRPYFRPGNHISRGQIAKIVNLARTHPTPTPTATRTRVPTRTPGTPTVTPTPGTPTATPTCAPSSKGWTAGQPLPTPVARGFGAYFPANGKFYSLGGRSTDVPGDAQLNPLEYDPGTDTWVAKSALFSDQQTSNVQGGVVILDGTPVIIVVGGSAGGGTGGTDETRVYNPVDDTLVTLTADPWPPGLTTVPGGSAVVDNKVYILGGFVINTGMSNEIWEFNPEAFEGERWTLMPTTLPAGRGYIPSVAIDGIIYMAGGSDWDGSTIHDTDFSYKYDPAAGTIKPIATIPRLTAETRAVNIGGKMWVLGGGRDLPNPSNQVDIYDPVADSWTTGLPFITARRNFSADTDGAGKIYLAGGYSGSTPVAHMQIYNPLVVCGTSTPIATHTPVPTTTVTPTPFAPQPALPADAKVRHRVETS
ncbi:MAG: S-layer homology domain-containing protein [Chloroflexia bacterium]